MSLPSPLSALSVETRTALRDALAQYLADPGDVVSLRRALRRVAEESHERELRAEQLMVAFKGLWRTMPQVRDVDDPMERAHLLERLITVCIEEYYA